MPKSKDLYMERAKGLFDTEDPTPEQRARAKDLTWSWNYTPERKVIPLINLSMGLAIADHPDDPDNKGLFICHHRTEGQERYEAIDNRREVLRTKVFDSYDAAEAWLYRDGTGPVKTESP